MWDTFSTVVTATGLRDKTVKLLLQSNFVGGTSLFDMVASMLAAA
jgi:hypothetical protein